MSSTFYSIRIKIYFCDCFLFQFITCSCCRVGAEFLKNHMNRDVVYYSDPTWGNHGLIFKNSGFNTINKYRYWDPGLLNKIFSNH